MFRSEPINIQERSVRPTRLGARLCKVPRYHEISIGNFFAAFFTLFSFSFNHLELRHSNIMDRITVITVCVFKIGNISIITKLE